MWICAKPVGLKPQPFTDLAKASAWRRYSAPCLVWKCWSVSMHHSFPDQLPRNYGVKDEPDGDNFSTWDWAHTNTLFGSVGQFFFCTIVSLIIYREK